MKQFKKLLLIAVCVFGVVGVANAQKTGHVDVRKIFLEMPETKKIPGDLEKIQKTWQAEGKKLLQEYQDKLNKYKAEAKSQTKETNEKRGKEIQTLQQKLQNFEPTLNEVLYQKKAELEKPVYEKILKATKDVAAEKGIVYVLNIANLVVYEKGNDITDDVMKKLGLKK
ncbi:MAG: OmpH family outer membrane protein [Flavobacteriaceae bacterium]|nr:OmpH family outer membrane protein [Flavobacteriaceae bacterium]